MGRKLSHSHSNSTIAHLNILVFLEAGSLTPTVDGVRTVDGVMQVISKLYLI